MKYFSMTRKDIETIYRTVVAQFPDNSIVDKIGIYEAKDMLCPGVVSVTYIEDCNENGVTIRTSASTLCWITDKQLTLKQLKKIVSVWTELMRDDSV